MERILNRKGLLGDWEEGQSILDKWESIVNLSRNKKRALETVSVSHNEEHLQTVVSSADGAKVLNNLDTLVKKLENLYQNPVKTFLGDVAAALGATKHGSNSQYASFETKNGKVVTIRLADHNAKVSNFDNHDELEGISIVVTPKKNLGVDNDGNAHIVEYYYDSIKLRRVEGKPLADIVRSIKQSLYSGEYKYKTGLAERQEVNEKGTDTPSINQPHFYRTSTGEVYGFAYNGKIYIDPRIAGADTPIHEYTHLWADAMKLANPKTWQRIVGIMEKQTKLWNDIAKQYPELEDKDTLAAEVLAHYSGSKGAERLQKLIDETYMSDASLYAQTIAAVHRMQKVLDTFWRAVAEKIGFRFSNAQTVADTILKDLLDENHTLASPATVRRDSVAPEMQEVQKRDTFYSNAQMAVEGPFKGVTWTVSWKVKNGLKLEPKEKAALKAAGIPYEGIADIKPIGKSSQFGNIYLQFKGKVKEAFDFMMQKKDGFLKAVFHRDEVGDIGLVWGNGKAGLYHIILKHVIKYDDFSSVNDVVNTIDDVIKTGQYSLQKDGRVAFTKDNYRVAIEKSEEGNWIISALDTSRKKKEKKRMLPFYTKASSEARMGNLYLCNPFLLVAKIENLLQTSKKIPKNPPPSPVSHQ